MGLDVFVKGRLRLGEQDEAALCEAVQGWLSYDIDGVRDLFTWVGQATIRRVDADWVELSWAEDGDPKWSAAATAFYAELGRFVREGQVDIGSVEDEWSYSYEPDRIVQHGTNGYDGEESLEESLRQNDPRR